MFKLSSMRKTWKEKLIQTEKNMYLKKNNNLKQSQFSL